MEDPTSRDAAPGEPNQQQRDYWNTTAQKWVAAQPKIDRSITPITTALYAFAAPQPGESVLDVGCGTGTTTFGLRERVGDGGTVVGVDIAEAMIAEARRRAAATDPDAERGHHPDVQFVTADAATFRFEPRFDLVFSRFGVMFFADPTAAFVNLRTAFTTGARLAFVCWRTLDDNPWAALPLATVKALAPPQPATDPHAPGPYALADGDRIHRILDAARFHEIRIERHDTTMILGPTLDEAVEETLIVGPASRLAAELDDATRDEYRKRVRAVLAPFTTDAGVAPPASVWLVGAR